MDYPNPFDEAEVVSIYTDGQAVEDGVLVAIGRKDRVSRAVWDWLAEKAPKGAQPPSCWPVDLMGWFQASKISKTDALKLIAEHGKDGAQQKFDEMIADRKALAMSSALIRTHATQATRVYEENTGGGIYKLWALEHNDVIEKLSAEDPGAFAGASVLWLMPNDNGGITLMFPEDY
jgi:hypothetical protein